MDDKLDSVWKALSDPTRREILDSLRGGALTTTEIVSLFPNLTRFGVMKHIEVLREACLINTRAEGRWRLNSLNVVPIRQIYERWVSGFQDLWASELVGLKRSLELEGDAKSGRGKPREPKTPRRKAKQH